MRYLVTGAAGFIGSQLLRTLLERGHDATGWDAFTDYYDPALKEENARGLPVARVDLAEDTLELDGFDGVFHLAGQPGVASFGGVFPVYVRQNVLASQRLFEAAAAAGVRVVFASSSSIYGDAAAYPTPEDTIPRPLSPYGITKLACEHLARAYGARVRARRRRPFATSRSTARASDRTWRSRRWSSCLAEGRAVRALRRRLAVAQLHVRRRRGRGDDRRDGARQPAARRSTSAAAAEVSMLEAIETLGRIAGRRLEVVRIAATRGRRGAHGRRHDADSRRDLGWEPATSFEEGLAAQWRWAADRVAAA